MRTRQWTRRPSNARTLAALRAALRAAASVALACAVAACSASNNRDDDEIEPFHWNFTGVPSVRLEAVELGRTRSPEGHTIVRYGFRGVGYPEPGPYELRTRNLSAIEFIAPSVYFDDGTLMIEDAETGEPRPFEIRTGTMLPGEGLSVAVYSPDIAHDDAYRAKTDLVPFPIEAEGAGGCRLTARVWTKLAYGIFVEGFSDGESLEMELVVGEWARRWPIENFKGGTRGLFVVDPRDSGYRAGVAKFYADSRSCSVVVELPFGESMAPR